MFVYNVPVVVLTPFKNTIMRPLCFLLAVSFCIPVLSLSHLMAGEPIRILCINVRFSTANDGENSWVHRKEFMTEMMIEGNYDFIGTQETLLHPNPDLNQMTYMASRLPGHGVYGISREVNPEVGEGMIMYYKKDRWEMDTEQRGTFWLSDTPDVPGSITWEAQSRNPRTVTWGLFHEIDRDGNRTGRAVYVYNTHFDHVSDPARRKSAQMIMQRIAARPHQDVPAIVIGDINAGEGSVPVRYMLGETVTIDGAEVTTPYKLVDTFRAVHPDATNVQTFNGFRPVDTVWSGQKIDYIFVSPSFRTISSEIIRTHRNGRFPTDHFPVNAVIAW